ncbi:hypothetical protein VTI74DRAFT_2801 [Chaetomium olivicolor]
MPMCHLPHRTAEMRCNAKFSSQQLPGCRTRDKNFHPIPYFHPSQNSVRSQQPEMFRPLTLHGSALMQDIVTIRAPAGTPLKMGIELVAWLAQTLERVNPGLNGERNSGFRDASSAKLSGSRKTPSFHSSSSLVRQWVVWKAAAGWTDSASASMGFSFPHLFFTLLGGVRFRKTNHRDRPASELLGL